MPIYDSYKQASLATGWPWRKLKLAKTLGSDGFNHNRVNWDKFAQWYAVADNKLKLDMKYDGNNKIQDIDGVKLENAIKDGILKDLEIQKRKENYLSPEEVSDFLIKLRLAFESTIRGFAVELAPKVIGQQILGEIEAIINHEINKLLNTFKDKIKEKISE